MLPSSHQPDAALLIFVKPLMLTFHSPQDLLKPGQTEFVSVPTVTNHAGYKLFSVDLERYAVCSQKGWVLN